jgi:hypothetical protein
MCLKINSVLVIIEKCDFSQQPFWGVQKKLVPIVATIQKTHSIQELLPKLQQNW